MAVEPYEIITDRRADGTEHFMSTTEPTIEEVILEMLQKPQMVSADGQTVRAHDLNQIIDAAQRLRGRTCLSPGYIQKIQSGGAWGA